MPFRLLQREVVSTRTGAALDRTSDLSSHLVSQLCEPVCFAEALGKAAQDVALLIEVGPGRMLTGLARDCVDTPTVALDTGNPSVRGLLSAFAAAWAVGAPIEPNRLFAGRITKPFDQKRTPRFFVNPAAQPLAHRAEILPQSIEGKANSDLRELGVADSALDLVTQLVATRCELPPDAIGATDRFLSDLHLTSIAVSTIASQATRELGRAGARCTKRVRGCHGCRTRSGNRVRRACHALGCGGTRGGCLVARVRGRERSAVATSTCGQR